MSEEDHVLRGERVALGPLRVDLADTYRRWVHDLGERRTPGLGTEAMRLVLDWAFNMLGLHNVILSVLPANVGAIRAYEKAGFQRVGVRRGAVLSLGEVSDEILMDAVRHEFESPVLAARR